MMIAEEIQRMSIKEKLLLMETLWDEICHSKESLDVPQWQMDLLDDRERMIEDGTARFLDWDTAKKQIEEMIS